MLLSWAISLLVTVCTSNLLSFHFPSECDTGLTGVWGFFAGRHGWMLLAQVQQARARVYPAGKELTPFEYCTAMLSIYSIKSKQVSAETGKTSIVAGDGFNMRKVS